MTAHFSMNSFRGKQVLALTRDGDYAHAGEEEAIDLAMEGLPKRADQPVLDAGCGRGGTAAYLQHQGWGLVTGIDQDAESVAAAAKRYPDIRFVAGEIADAPKRLDRSFALVTMFNVLYAIPDPARALGALAQVTAPGGRLMIFDYVDLGGYADHAIMDAGNPFLPNPPTLSDLPDRLTDAGWTIERLTRIDEDYERWYRSLVAKIEAKREEIEALVGPASYDHVHHLYSSLLANIHERRLGGIGLQARRES